MKLLWIFLVLTTAERRGLKLLGLRGSDNGTKRRGGAFKRTSPHRSIGINTPMIQTPGHFGMFKPVESDDIYARGQRLADFQSDMFNDVSQEQQMMMADDSSLLGPRSVVQTENDKDPISRIEKVTSTLIDWAETYVPTYIRKEKLYLFATKLRQQFIGNLKQCRIHPEGDSKIKQRSNIELLQENRTLLEKLVPNELAAATRSRYQLEKENPLELLDKINFVLTRVIKQHLLDCKRFKHFARLRDTGIKQYIRAYIRYTKNQAIKNESNTMEEFDYVDVDEDGLIDETEENNGSVDDYGVNTFN